MFKIFENLKKQFFEKWKNFESQLLESNTFNLLRERYQSLDILQQTLIKYLSVFVVFAVLAYFPFSYFLSSSSYWREFKEKQNVSLNLLNMRKKISSSVFHYSQNQLKNKIENIIRKYSTTDFKLTDKRSLLQEGGSIYQIDFDVQLSHLNVKQAVKLGTELHNLSQARLDSVVMEENKKFPKHYDVVYKVSAFVSTETVGRTAPRRQRRPLKSRDKKLKTNQNRVLKEKADDHLKTESDDKLRKENKPGKNTRRREFKGNKGIKPGEGN